MILNSLEFPEHDLEPPTMILSVPQCTSDSGEYNPVQEQGELSWCVHPDGTANHESLTRGSVQCSRNGTMLGKRSLGPVCPYSDKRPLVCTDQCMAAICHAHPDALCIMDVCDSCKPSFYK